MATETTNAAPTLREIYAGQALQGLLASPHEVSNVLRLSLVRNSDELASALASWAVTCADALIAELAKKGTP